MCADDPANNTNQDRGANVMSLNVIKNLLCFLCGDVLEIAGHIIAVLTMNKEMLYAADVIKAYSAIMAVSIGLLMLLNSCVRKKVVSKREKSTKQSRTFCYYFKCAVKYAYRFVCLFAGIVMEYVGCGVAGLISWSIDVARAYKHGNIDWSQVALVILAIIAIGIFFLVAIGIISILEYILERILKYILEYFRRKRSSEENTPEQAMLNDTETEV